MPRKQAVARNVSESSESEDPTEVLASAQQKMTTLQKNRNRRRRTVSSKHAEEFGKIKKRIDARLDADRKRIEQAQRGALEKYLDAVASVIDIEKKIQGKIWEMQRQCGRFVGLMSLVHDGRAKEALQVDLKELERRVSCGSVP